MKTLFILSLLILCAATLPPYPGQTKASSPKSASSPDVLNKSMVLSVSNFTVTNRGHVSADFAATKIVGLSAGFVYATNEQTGPWKVLVSTNYPAQGGTLTVNYVATNLPHLYFRAFYQFPNPTP